MNECIKLVDWIFSDTSTADIRTFFAVPTTKDSQNRVNASTNAKRTSNSSQNAKRRNAEASGALGASTRTGNSFGSKTIVTKSRKTTSSTPQEHVRQRQQQQQQFVPFSGTGNRLGDAQSASHHPGTSKLVPDARTREGTSSSDPQRDASLGKGTKIAGGSLEDVTSCPLCGAALNSGQFEPHIAECLGDMSDDFDALRPTRNESRHGNSEESRSLRNYEVDDSVVMISDDEDDARRTYSVSSNMFKDSGGTCKRIETANASATCPVCEEKFDQSDITRHVNEHFD